MLFVSFVVAIANFCSIVTVGTGNAGEKPWKAQLHRGKDSLCLLCHRAALGNAKLHHNVFKSGFFV